MKGTLIRLAVVALLAALAACAHAISERARAMVDPAVSAKELFARPEAFRGRVVMLGGFIVGVRLTEDRTHIEVVQKPLDRTGRPREDDVTEGRFIVVTEGYLDPAIYSPGRELTVAGEVLGRELRPLGDAQYPYVLVRAIEMRLFKAYEPLPVRFGIGVITTF
ncbi:MAG: hypothetical protein Kow0025_05980 [Thermodesulfovibrionales bacterium]